jgi:hypothetical protein
VWAAVPEKFGDLNLVVGAIDGWLRGNKPEVVLVFLVLPFARRTGFRVRLGQQDGLLARLGFGRGFLNDFEYFVAGLGFADGVGGVCNACFRSVFDYGGWRGVIAATGCQ